MRTFIRGLWLVCLLLGLSAGSAIAEGYQDLTPFLIDLPGFEAQPGDGMQFDMGGQRLIQAVRTYEDGDREVNAMVMIGDQMLTQAPLQEFSFESGHVSGQVEKVGDFTVQSSYDKTEGSGAVFVMLQQSGNEGSIFVLAYRGLSADEGMALAKRFDWPAMQQATAALFRVKP